MAAKQPGAASDILIRQCSADPQACKALGKAITTEPRTWTKRLMHPDFSDWLAYFRRTFPATAGVDDYERHMKYGPTREYWNDYVFEAYVNYQAEAIYLAGLPDIPEGRPHSEASERNGWKARAFIRES